MSNTSWIIPAGYAWASLTISVVWWLVLNDRSGRKFGRRAQLVGSVIVGLGWPFFLPMCLVILAVAFLNGEFRSEASTA